MTSRAVWPFGFGPPTDAEPSAAVLGGKGAGLAAMRGLGLPVPPGFTLATSVCDAYYLGGRTLPDALRTDLRRALDALGAATGTRFGDSRSPLLVSVRSGAPVSMPGMMDTVLNVGLATAGADDPFEQLWNAIVAVLQSWQSPRAVAYRRLHEIADRPGTAVTIQAMVFGNAGGDSATGVAFTRDPATGAPEPFGEYLPNAQGDEVVSGTVTPRPLTRLQREGLGTAEPSLEEVMPQVYAELTQHFRALEAHFGAMQDVEFTIDRGRLWLLQTRTGTAGVEAAARIAVDMVREGLIDRRRALARFDRGSLARAHHVRVRRGATPLTRGIPASPGAVSGAVVFSSDEADAAAARGAPAILVLPETHPRDVHGMHAAAGILTSRGGATSHAAVVARGIGKPCVVGADALSIDPAGRRFLVAGREVRGGEVVTLDGATGEVFLGEQAMERPEPSPAVATLLAWARDPG
ncbi:MAG: hypothetical protein FJX64_03730 [Alphaproteobacteria bacterium]|nr:hypothetical protein [Alphaproteobacteria bacterium]